MKLCYPNVAHIKQPFLTVSEHLANPDLEIDVSNLERIDVFELKKLVAVIKYRKNSKLSTRICGSSEYFNKLARQLNLDEVNDIYSG